MLEAIVPVSNRLAVRRNLDRLDLLLKSCEFFWTGSETLKFHIIVPDNEFAEIAEWIVPYEHLAKLNLLLHRETDISPLIGNIPASLGVLKQMLIKLSAFEIVKSPYCILFDSDIVACKPFNDQNLIVGGRALTEWWKPSLYQWWFESARVLGYEIMPTDLQKLRIFVTPQILCEAILRPMLEDISKKLEASWLEGLISEYSGKHPNIWTEYTLYDLYAEHTGLREKYHLFQDEIPNERLHCMEQSLWGAKKFATWDPLRAINGQDPGYFLVLQSITANALDFDLVKARWLNAVQSRFDNYPSDF